MHLKKLFTIFVQTFDMKPRRVLFISAIVTAGVLQAIEPAAQWFAAMPDSLVPTIEVNRRKDLIDLFHAGQKAQVATQLGGWLK